MSEIPLWGAILVAVFMLGGSAFALVGCFGLLNFKSFYPRVHAPTLGTSMGMGGVMVASMIYFSLTQEKPLIHEVLIIVFMTVTTPVTLMLLARAALYRDRIENNPDVPRKRFAPPSEETTAPGA